jgi:hypothetical protein
MYNYLTLMAQITSTNKNVCLAIDNKPFQTAGEVSSQRRYFEAGTGLQLENGDVREEKSKHITFPGTYTQANYYTFHIS